MNKESEDAVLEKAIILQQSIDSISNQLCLAVKRNFDFSVETESADEKIQKLTMLINFVLDNGRRALHSLNEQNEKLTSLDKLKTDFLANVSHELRTPLTLILGPLQSLCEQHTSLPPQYKVNLERMHRNALRLYTLVNDLLDFSKLEAGKLEVHLELTNPNQLVSNIIDDAQDLAYERGLGLTFTSSHDFENIALDRNMFEKIVMNLLSNALKFTPERGTIKVHTEKQNNMFSLSVKDSGVGIPESEISKLFERFHQVDNSSTRKHAGTGIGLALIHQFITLMKGSIQVESKINQGTKFTVNLPIKNYSSDAIPQKDITKKTTGEIKVSLSKFADKKVATRNHEQILEDQEDLRPLILVADDNADMNSYIVSLLEETYKVISVENGRLALDAVYKHQPYVILSDVMMPELNGFEFTQKIKQNPLVKHIPIILLTAKSGKESIVDGLECGADDYLPKPFSPEELMARVRSALRMYQINREIMALNDSLKGEIEEKKKVEIKNASLTEELMLASRRAGMSDVASGVLHNIGNVLNSICTSVSLVDQKISACKISNLSEVSNLIQQHEDDLAAFISQNEKGKHLPIYISKLSDIWARDKEYLKKEIQEVGTGLQHIKDILSKQISLSDVLGSTVEVNIAELIRDALALNKVALQKNSINIIQDFEDVKKPIIDRVKALQIIVNLVKNGIEALQENNKANKEIVLSIKDRNSSHVIVQIKDNGIGISSENLSKMFTQGFTTKAGGHGIGLHTSIIDAQNMGGDLLVESDGLEKGATFSLVLPYHPTMEDTDHA